MADSKDGPTNTASNTSPTGAAASNAASSAAKAAPKPQNPVFKMMGLPNIRWKLPSRNWTIFLTLVGSWTGAWIYDRQQKKVVQKKWCDLVSHLAQEQLPANQLPRKMTVYLAAPPADGVMTAREHFHEYVKPVLVAAAMDWDAVEGRREGDVRAQLAERVRRLRKRKGEKGREGTPEEEEVITEANVEEIRQRLGVGRSSDVEGDIVIGRHTWKEYVRGLHEGWLGPLDLPPERKEEEGDVMEVNGNGNGEKPPPDRPHDIGSIPTYAAEKVLQRATASRHKDDKSPNPATLDTTSKEPDPSSPLSSDEAFTTTKPPEEKKDQEASSSSSSEETKEKKKRKQPPPYISSSDYSSASLSPSTPEELGPLVTIPFPHILGFRNTPIRMYRFLTRRYLADDIGREVASAVLAAYRPYHHSEGEFSPDSSDGDAASPTAGVDVDGASATDSRRRVKWEQEDLLKGEEKEWHKSVKKREEGDRKERTWLDPMVLDDRIAGRMRRFELSREEEERARQIGEGREGPRKVVKEEE